MATAHRASGTPTPGRSARAGRKRDGIPWHSPLTEVVKGALYRVFWTAGITRRLQVQHRPQGVDGSTRSCPQLYCSFVQYTSEMLFRRCGGNTGSHHHVAAATLRCPRGGVAKSAFEILIHFLYTTLSGLLL